MMDRKYCCPKIKLRHFATFQTRPVGGRGLTKRLRKKRFTYMLDLAKIFSCIMRAPFDDWNDREQKLARKYIRTICQPVITEK
jgi:hypothetical protein